MKRITALFLTICLCVGLCACGNSSATSKGSHSGNSNTSSTTAASGKGTLSDSARQSLAEDAAMKKLYEYMQSTPAKFYKYNISATKYSLGSTTGPDRMGNFNVNGKLYLYDKYGSLEDTATFTCKVNVDDTGTVCAFNPTVNIL